MFFMVHDVAVEGENPVFEDWLEQVCLELERLPEIVTSIGVISTSKLVFRLVSLAVKLVALGRPGTVSLS